MMGSGASFIPQKSHVPLLKTSVCQQLHALFHNVQMILKMLLKKNSPAQDAGKDLFFTQLRYLPCT